ncbi:rhodanese-like domain-containing protein [Candidatus Dependentiae bacterium]|nr:rhodanese-like domain-containing protein [Candidatus Dependentiae bacterium]
MKKILYNKIILLISIFILVSCNGNKKSISVENEVNFHGKIINGIREIILNTGENNISLNIYRGDYVIFRTSDNQKYLLQIPDLKINQTIPELTNSKSYIKFPDSGTFDFLLGSIKGKIMVHEYRTSNYKEVTASEAINIINNIEPVILDVRTKNEFENGHLKNSILIPVQEIQKRYNELEKYKTSPIFIYCASGNRSTVASRILIENGYKIIYNLRYGISDWISKGYPIEH